MPQVANATQRRDIQDYETDEQVSPCSNLESIGERFVTRVINESFQLLLVIQLTTFEHPFPDFENVVGVQDLRGRGVKQLDIPA
jgi:hypothetical protein